MVSAAALINNGPRFERSIAGFHEKTVYTGVLGTVCEYMVSVHRGTIILNSSE